MAFSTCLSICFFRCVTDIPDECANNFGGCWHDDYKVNGNKKTFSACQDNLEMYKVRRFATKCSFLS